MRVLTLATHYSEDFTLKKIFGGNIEEPNRIEF